MASKTFYFKNAVPGGATLHRSLQDGGAAPSSATTTTGWVAAQNVIGQSCIQNGNVEIGRADAQWSATLRPSTNPSQTLGDCWRSESTMNGTFANTDWTFAFGLRSVTAAYTGRFKLGVRAWRSTNANGSGATELTGARVASSATSANLSTTADTTVTITWTPGATKTLTDEYLFVNVGIEITAAGSGNTQDVDLRVGSAYSITTPDFTALLAGQAAASALGALFNGVTLPGFAGASATGTLLSGSVRAYLSWAKLTLPAFAGTNQALTGQAAVAHDGAFAFAGAQRAYLSWARLTLPPTNDAGLSGVTMAAARGTLTPFLGAIQALTGQSVASAYGAPVVTRGATLSSATLAAVAGALLGTTETIIFQGAMTLTISLPLAGLAMGSARGLLGIIKTGETLAPLVGQSAASVIGPLPPGVVRGIFTTAGVVFSSGAITIPQGLVVGLTGLALVAADGELGVTFIVGGSVAAVAGALVNTISPTLTGLEAATELMNISPLWQGLPPDASVWSPINRSTTPTWSDS